MVERWVKGAPACLGSAAPLLRLLRGSKGRAKRIGQTRWMPVPVGIPFQKDKGFSGCLELELLILLAKPTDSISKSTPGTWAGCFRVTPSAHSSRILGRAVRSESDPRFLRP